MVVPSISIHGSSVVYMRFLVALWGTVLFAAADPAVTQVRTVYVMPMGSGLDQYLANRLAEEQLFEVVTDPALADAVLTDRIGPAFEHAFATLYPPPPPPEDVTEKLEESDKKKIEKDKKTDAADTTIGAAMADRPETAPRMSSFSRGKGNVFLIDRKSRRVLWSEFRSAKNSRPEEMNRLAEKLIGQLETDLEQLRKPAK